MKLNKIYKNIKLDSVFFQKKENDNFVPIDNLVLPLKIDNRQRLSPVDNQGNTSACVCYSTCSIAESVFWRRNGFPMNFNALDLYKECKKVDGKPRVEGTFPEVGLSCALKFGIFGDIDGKITTIRNDGTENTVDKVKQAVFKYDFMLGGFKITDDMYNLVNGRYLVTGNGKPLGGHCMTICGWNKSGIIVQNQWGTDFGAKGFCIYPYDIFMKQFIYGAFLTNIYDKLD